jgi:hypothetical protein
VVASVDVDATAGADASCSTPGDVPATVPLAAASPGVEGDAPEPPREIAEAEGVDDRRSERPDDRQDEEREHDRCQNQSAGGRERLQYGSRLVEPCLIAAPSRSVGLRGIPRAPTRLEHPRLLIVGRDVPTFVGAHDRGSR